MTAKAADSIQLLLRDDDPPPPQPGMVVLYAKRDGSRVALYLIDEHGSVRRLTR